MPAADLAARVHRLARIPGSALAELLAPGSTWGPHEENTALLLEAQAYALDLAWADRTTDPDDPAVKRERAVAKRAGIKPPPHPLIPPIAHRPHAMAERRLQEYLDAVQKYQTGPSAEATHLTSREFDIEMGLVAELV